MFKPINTKLLRVLAPGAAYLALGLVFLNIYNTIDAAYAIPAIKGNCTKCAKKISGPAYYANLTNKQTKKQICP